MREEDKLVRRMAAGDEDAAEALVARYYAEILRYCRWHSADSGAGGGCDAGNVSALHPLRRAALRRPRQTAGAAYQIARHTCIDMARRRSLTMCRWKMRRSQSAKMRISPRRKKSRALRARMPKRSARSCSCVCARI